MLSESDKDNEALDRLRPDRKPCSPLPFSALRDSADADGKASAQRRNRDSEFLRRFF